MSKIEIDPKTTALILIDLQKGILAMKTSPHEGVDLVRRCAETAEKFRKAGAPVIYVRVDMANFLQLVTETPPRPPAPAEAMDLLPEAGARDGDLFVTKRHWSAFPGTGLEALLREHGVKTIAIGGVATNFGVESTAREASGLGFNVVFLEDAMSTVTTEAHRFAITTIFPRIGRVRVTSDLSFPS